MCAAAAGLAVTCSPRHTPEADDRATLNRLREEFVAAENRGDADAMYSQLAPDVIVMAPNMPAMGGPQLTPEEIRSFFEMFSYDNRYQSQEIVISGDWAFDRGIGTEIVTNKKDGTVTKSNAKYLWIYRRVDGVWKQARVIWNSSDPAPAATAK
jgi:ketosteroid isomerase-like protein